MRVRVDVRTTNSSPIYIYRKISRQTTRLARSRSPINERFQDFQQDSRLHVEISGPVTRMRHRKIGVSQGTKVNKLYSSPDFNGDFPDFTKDFRDFRDFTKDFFISTKISGFRERLREISEVYEISVSGGPLDYVATLTAHAHVQIK